MNFERASQRAKAEVRRACMAIEADHLLTLTYRENVTDRAQTLADFQRFARLMRDTYGRWSYVAVMERQKRGAWHWHIAVNGKVDVRRVRALWMQATGAGQGNANIQVTYYGGKWGHGAELTLRLARYIAKYIAKSFAEWDARKGERRYQRSIHTMRAVVVVREWFGTLDAALTWFAERTDHRIAVCWEHPDGFCGYAATWNIPPVRPPPQAENERPKGEQSSAR